MSSLHSLSINLRTYLHVEYTDDVIGVSIDHFVVENLHLVVALIEYLSAEIVKVYNRNA